MSNNSSLFQEFYDSKKILFKNPLYLTEHYNQQAEIYLPRMTGIEIECSILDYKKGIEEIDKIEGILENKSSQSELRFKLDIGLIGLKALYLLCESLKRYFQLSSSGIHLHIDFPEVELITEETLPLFKDDVLKELDTWNYQGTYNSRAFRLHKGGWIGVRTELKTLEIRICEMTFDYEKLVKRIVHAHFIGNFIRRTLADLGKKVSFFHTLTNYDVSMIRLNNQLEEIKEKERVQYLINSMINSGKDIIHSRKIYVK